MTNAVLIPKAKITWDVKEAAILALQRDGDVDADDLIAAARDPTHPCHDDFTWDVGRAAEERWKDQAQALIRRVRFAVIEDDVNVKAPQFIPSRDGEDVFHSLTEMRSPTKISSTLIAEVAQLLGVAHRVYGIALAKKDMVDGRIVNQLKGVCDRVRKVKEQLSS